MGMENNPMNSVLGRIGDRVLEVLVPKTTAKADTSFWSRCYCGTLEGTTYRYERYCNVVGGHSSCGPCELRGIGC